MSRKIVHRWMLPLLLIVAASACSTANEDSPLYLVNESGDHPAGWTEAHRSYYSPEEDTCMVCHGEFLLGGISRVSCFESSYNGRSCHGGEQTFHVESYLDKSFTGTDVYHATAYEDNIWDCALCHTPPPLDEPYEGDCWICHFGTSGARSPGGWVHDLLWHERFIGTIYEPICLNCHNTNNFFGHEPFCHNCH